MIRVRFLALSTLVLASAVSIRGENWPQWRGPGGQGVSSETKLPTTWAPGKNILWKTELPGTGHSSPVVWGDRVFVTAVIEGEAVPGQQAAPHTQGGKPFVHPDSVAADKKHTFKVVALDSKTGKILWDKTAYDGTVFDARHRRSSFAGPTPATDGTMIYAYFGPEGLYAYDFEGNEKWKVVEKFPTLGLAAGTSPVLHENLVIIQRDEDNGDNSVIVAYDKKTGKEAWRTKRDTQITWGDARDRAGGRPRRARHQRNRIDHRVRSGDRKGTLANGRRAQQRDPHAAGRQRPGDRDRRIPREEGHRHSPGHRRRQARGLGVLEGDRIRRLEHSLRRLPLPPHRQRHRDVSESRDRRGEVRRRTHPQAGPLHGIAGGLLRVRRA